MFKALTISMIFTLLITACAPNLPSALTQTPSLTPSPTATPLPSPTPTITCSPTPQPTPTLIGGYPGRYIDFGTGISGFKLHEYNADGKYIRLFYEIQNATIDNWSGGNLQWSPDGKMLALNYYAEGGYLVLLSQKGEEVFSTGPNAYSMSWTNDGSWLYFTNSGEHSYIDIFRIDQNGENLQQLTNTYSNEEIAFMLPGGNMLAYRVEAALYAMDLDGTNVHILGDASSVISPDGKLLASSMPTGRMIKVINTENYEEKILYQIPAGSKYWIGDYKFSPDGKWIYFFTWVPSFQDRPPNQVFRFNLDNPDKVELVGYGSFRFTPDGTGIILNGWLSSEGNLTKAYWIPFDGSTWIEVNQAAGEFGWHSWIPESIPYNIYDTSLFLLSTPLPSWKKIQLLEIYDSFDSKTIDTTKWNALITNSKDLIEHKIYEGALNLQCLNMMSDEKFFYAKNGVDSINTFISVQAKMKLWGGSYGTGFSFLQISDESGNWRADCRLGVQYDNPEFYCEVVQSPDRVDFKTKKIDVNLSQWYDVQIDISPQTGAFQFYLDDELLGTYLPEKSTNILKGIPLTPKIGVECWYRNLNVSFDDIRIGK